ncbi:MAG: rhomboid family intramembrane serine protease [Deltaproteobacteria bacterium]|nr:rhomboid family intramembrane serine protease [Deltaproteobacteria bacterium]
MDPRTTKPSLPVVTIVLAAANVIAFGASIAAGADPITPTTDIMFDLGGNYGPVTLGGQSWRLVTSMFLHVGLLHLVMNMVGLIDGGRHVERMYGRLGFVALYLFSGVAGSLASALPGKAVSAGASGAIFGVFGAWAAFLFLHRSRFDKETLGTQARGLLVFLAFNIWFGMSSSAIDMRAHVGGLFAGFAAGLILSPPGHQRVRIAAVFVAAACVIGAAHVVPTPPADMLIGSSRERYNEFVALQMKALERFDGMAKSGATDEAIADVIEKEILPTWREGKVLAWKVDYAPPGYIDNLRAYVETRERAFVEMVAAIRKQDHDAAMAAMKLMTESAAYVEKLKL